MKNLCITMFTTSMQILKKEKILLNIAISIPVQGEFWLMISIMLLLLFQNGKIKELRILKLKCTLEIILLAYRIHFGKTIKKLTGKLLEMEKYLLQTLFNLVKTALTPSYMKMRALFS